MTAAPIRTAAELEARVARMNPERTQKLEAQVRFLADLAAMALALEIRGEQAAADAEVPELADRYREAQNLLLDSSAHFTARREQMRGTVEYERARLRIRESLVQHLKAET